jgi:hypothetical protein
MCEAGAQQGEDMVPGEVGFEAEDDEPPVGHDTLESGTFLFDDDSLANISDEDFKGPEAEPGMLDDDYWANLPSSDEEADAAAPGLLPPAMSAAAGLSGWHPGSSSSDTHPPTGAASSSAAEAPHDIASRRAAAQVLFVPGGKISFYIGKQDVECVCMDPRHGFCRLTRRMVGSTWVARQGQGRPLGQCMAWLAVGAECTTKAMHSDFAKALSRDQRLAGRAALKACDHPDARGLLAMERAKRDGESSEPEVI